jgi:hypothetical protein
MKSERKNKNKTLIKLVINNELKKKLKIFSKFEFCKKLINKTIN